MIMRLLPFICMAPFALWCAWSLFKLRGRFWYATSILIMATTAVFGFLMMFSGVVI